MRRRSSRARWSPCPRWRCDGGRTTSTLRRSSRAWPARTPASTSSSTAPSNSMYEGYWGLAEPPFNNSPNPKFFYLSPEHEEALVRLVYTVRHRKGCAMLTGEYGCGKTTLSRALIQRLEAEPDEIVPL